MKGRLRSFNSVYHNYSSQVERGSPFTFRPVLEPPDSKGPFIVHDPRELKYLNPQIPMIVGFCSSEGLMNTIGM